MNVQDYVPSAAAVQKANSLDGKETVSKDGVVTPIPVPSGKRPATLPFGSTPKTPKDKLAPLGAAKDEDVQKSDDNNHKDANNRASGNTDTSAPSAEYKRNKVVPLAASSALETLSGKKLRPPSDPNSVGRLLWRKLRDAIYNNERLKEDIAMHNTLMGGMKGGAQDMADVGDVARRVVMFSQFVIMPRNNRKKQWDLVQLVILLYLAFSIPIRVCFDVPAMGFGFVLELMIDIYFFFDIFVNFLSAYTNEATNEVVTDPCLIARKYLLSWFLLDVVALLPMDYVMRGLDGTFICSLSNAPGCSPKSSAAGYLKMVRMLRLIKLVKLLRLIKLGSLMEKYQDDLFDIMWILSMLKLVAVMVFFAHFNGAMFYFFSDRDWMSTAEEERLAAGEITPWLFNQFGDEYESAPLEDRYMAALYWAFATITTVGYGDISATTISERCWANCAMVLGTFFFSFLLGSIVTEVETAYMTEMAFNTKMLSVRAFVHDQKLMPETRSKVLSYFRTQKIRSYDEKGLLFELPFDIRQSILHELYRDLITSVYLFSSTRDDILITELCSRVNPISHTKGSYVYKTGEPCKQMFILAEGQVEVTDPKGRIVYALFDKGSYFGEECCFDFTRRLESIRCCTNVSVLEIGADDMDEILIMFPGLKKQMKSIHGKRQLEWEKFKKEVEKDKREGKQSLLFEEDDFSSVASSPKRLGEILGLDEEFKSRVVATLDKQERTINRLESTLATIAGKLDATQATENSNVLQGELVDRRIESSKNEILASFQAIAHELSQHVILPSQPLAMASPCVADKEGGSARKDTRGLSPETSTLTPDFSYTIVSSNSETELR